MPRGTTASCSRVGRDDPDRVIAVLVVLVVLVMRVVVA